MSKITELLTNNGFKPTGKTDTPPPGDGTPPPAGGAGSGSSEDNPPPPPGNDNPPPPGSGDENPPPPGNDNPPPAGSGENNPPPPPPGDDIPEDVLFAALQKRGFKGKSLEELTKPAARQLSPEEEAAAQQERQDSMRQFALRNKLVTSTDFDNYVKETNLPKTDLAFLLYRKERLEELKGSTDEMPTDEALRNEFDEIHHLYADENDPKRKRAEKLLNKTVDDYIDDKYSAIVSLEDTFTAHESEKEQRGVYNGIVKTVLGELGNTMEFVVKDGKTEVPVKFNISPQLIAKIEKNYMADLSFQSFGKDKVSKDLLLQAIRGNVIASEFDQIITEAAVAYHAVMFEQIPKGRRGIIPTRETGSDGGEKRENKIIKGILQRPENQKLIKNP
jgi:hypothetical protein